MAERKSLKAKKINWFAWFKWASLRRGCVGAFESQGGQARREEQQCHPCHCPCISAQLHQPALTTTRRMNVYQRVANMWVWARSWRLAWAGTQWCQLRYRADLASLLPSPRGLSLSEDNGDDVCYHAGKAKQPSCCHLPGVSRAKTFAPSWRRLPAPRMGWEGTGALDTQPHKGWQLCSADPDPLWDQGGWCSLCKGEIFGFFIDAECHIRPRCHIKSEITHQNNNIAWL